MNAHAWLDLQSHIIFIPGTHFSSVHQVDATKPSRVVKAMRVGRVRGVS